MRKSRDRKSERESKKWKTEEDVIRYFKDRWEEINPYGEHEKQGQLKDPKEIDRFKRDLALKLLVPSTLGARRRRTMTVDSFPQQLTIVNAISAANTYTQIETGVPINRLSVEDDKAWVIEISKIQLSCGLGSFDLGASELEEILIQLSTSSLTTINIGDPTVFWFHRSGVRIREITAASGITAVWNPESLMYDLTVNGRGILVATDSVFCGIDSLNLASAFTAVLKIYYKYVQIGIAEYVGIVQGQVQNI